MTTAQALESVLNAWVNGRKVRDGIPLTIRQQAEQALLTADAQATVEALQRERDGLEAKCLEEHVTAEQAQAALDAERDRLRANLINCSERLAAYYGDNYPAVVDARAALTPADSGGKDKHGNK